MRAGKSEACVSVPTEGACTTTTTSSIDILLLPCRHTLTTPTKSTTKSSANDAGFGRWAHVGLPGGDTTYLFKENFVVCYDGELSRFEWVGLLVDDWMVIFRPLPTPRTNTARTRNPKWVMERVTRATAVGDADRRVIEFREEKGILDPRFRTQNADYLMSE